MRRSTQRKLNNLGLVAMVLGALVIGGFALKLLLDTAPETPKPSETLGPIESEVLPTDTATPFTPPSPSSTTPASGKRKVKIAIESDGTASFAYKFGDGELKVQNATRSFSITKTVSGSPLAQVSVQPGPDATYVKCAIAVDGVQKSVEKSGTQPIAICTV